MKKLLMLVLVLSILPLAMSAGDKFWVHASDGSSYINGTDVCVDVFGSKSCFSEIMANSSGDITAVNTNGPYLSGGATSGAVSLLVNDTYLNATITTIATGLSGDNSSWNETKADGLYIAQGDEGNLNVNKSDYWDLYNTANTTWFENVAGVLGINITQLTSWLDGTWFGTKDTDDLSEGSVNLYQNQSFNQSWTDGLYADISVTGDNSSFNQSLTDGLYIAQSDEGDLNVNKSDYWDELNTTNETWFENIAGVLGINLTTLTTFIDVTIPSWFTTENATIARIGNCTGGQFMVNSTKGGVECATPSGSGDITSVEGDDIYIYNGSGSGDVVLVLNETKLNDTIDLRDTDTNCSAIGSCGNVTYNLSSFDTDDLTEGSVNLYDNQSWNYSAYWNNASGTFSTGAHATDTNASTACSAGEHLDGALGCINTNNTIDEKIAALQIEYNVTSVDTMTGTLDAGNLASLLVANDGDTYNVSEVGGVPGFDIRFNFTNVTSFNRLALREYYIGSSIHSVHLEFWVNSTSSWDQVNGEINGQNGFAFLSITIANSASYIDNNNLVQFRLYHGDSGTPSHDFFTDFIQLAQETGTIFGGGHDDTTGRDNCSTNHDNALCVNGSIRNATILFVTGNITAGLIKGTINEEANLNVNKSDYWDLYNTANSTWFENVAGVLGINLTKLTSWLDDTWFVTKDTDDLSEGSVNLYGNSSWNETKADGLYADISVTGDNSSWNETLGNTLYAPITIDGTVTSVAAGNGMDFSTITATGSCTMGTPSTLTISTANALTATSHTHEITGLINQTATTNLNMTDNYNITIGGCTERWNGTCAIKECPTTTFIQC